MMIIFIFIEVLHAVLEVDAHNLVAIIMLPAVSNCQDYRFLNVFNLLVINMIFSLVLKTFSHHLLTLTVPGTIPGI